MQGLQGKKVIAIATGSLHCVCCTEEGRWWPLRPGSVPASGPHVTVHAAQGRAALERPACRLGPRWPGTGFWEGPPPPPPPAPGAHVCRAGSAQGTRRGGAWCEETLGLRVCRRAARSSRSSLSPSALRGGLHLGRQRRGAAGGRDHQRHPEAEAGGRPAGEEGQPRGLRLGTHAGLVDQQARQRREAARTGGCCGGSGAPGGGSLCVARASAGSDSGSRVQP